MTPPPPPTLLLGRGSAAVIDRLARSEDGGAPTLATTVELVDDGERLIARFDCDDPEPWATYLQRDAPLWEEEVVELFVAPGTETPGCYLELEVNPLGTIFAARVTSPFGDRRALTVERGWNCHGLDCSATLRGDGTGWNARLALPWRALAALAPEAPADHFRINLFRIDRPARGTAEFSAWSPTFVTPADFHRPGRFGFLRRVG